MQQEFPAGVDAGDIAVELGNAYSGEEWLKNKPFTPVREDKVQKTLGKMQHPERCIVRKGYFPDSATVEADCAFAFVSLDMDLYAPLRTGLEFFYQRLSPGGFIFLHDYNHDILSGGKAAVREVEAIFGKLHKVPLADGSGTLVITKQ